MTDFNFAELEPQVLWRRFGELVAVPRPSKDEGRAIEYVRSWAQQHGFEARGDSAGNLCVHVPATDGFAGCDPVIIQGCNKQQLTPCLDWV